MPIENTIANMLGANGAIPSSAPYVPSEFKGRQKQHFADATRKFTQKNARYADDYVLAEVQGVDPERSKYEYTNQYVRFADSTSLSALTGKSVDDYKTLIFANPQIRFISHGTKIKAMGSTWIVIDCANISRAQPEVVAARCQTGFGYYDYYMNPQYEPAHISTDLLAAASPDVQLQFRMMTGYVRVVMQKNKITEQLSENSRIILGSRAFLLSGYSDFSREFTDEEDSVDLVEFYAHATEVNSVLDDMQNHVAGGKALSWVIRLSGTESVTEGATIQLSAESLKNGLEIAPTEDFPITYSFISSDENVATVSNSGVVRGITAGTATITCILDQNLNITATLEIEVLPKVNGTSVAIIGAVPKSLSTAEETTLSAAVYLDGEEVDAAVKWSVSGGRLGAYRYATGDDNSITITSFGYAPEPLVLTASYGEAEATASIQLLN